MDSSTQYNAVVTDYELERGELPQGLVHISTVTHAWRGNLKAVTPSYYILSGDKQLALVDSTGPMGDYLNDPTKGSESDVFNKAKGPDIYIPRSAVAWIISFKG